MNAALHHSEAAEGQHVVLEEISGGPRDDRPFMQLHRATGVMCGSLAGSSASHGAMACSSIHPSLAIYEGFLPFWTGCHCKEEMVQYVVGTAPHT